MQKLFLIDANLPRFFAIWNADEYIHQYDLGDEWSDTRIWKYAEAVSLTIITKDSDFSSRILLHEPPPKIIHIKLGNMKMKEFHAAINKIWSQVIELNKDFKLINVFKDRIEGVK